MEASFTIFALLVLAGATVFWLWALVDVLRRPDGTYRTGGQLLWALVIALTHTIGAVAYVLFGRPRSVDSAASVGR